VAECSVGFGTDFGVKNTLRARDVPLFLGAFAKL
jgi:hypothetical protein